MKTELPTIGRCVITATGNFNPAIFQPTWFERHNILPADETAGLFAEPCKKELPEIGITIEYGQKFLVESTQSVIHFQSLSLKVTRDKFEVFCEQPESFSLCIELVQKIFKMLPETPIKSYGINFFEHVAFDNSPDAIMHSFFDKKKLMDDWFGNDAKCGFTVKCGYKEGRLRCTVEPSIKLEDAMYLSFNFSYENENQDAKKMVACIRDIFSDNLEFVRRLIDANFGKVTNRKERMLAP